MGTQTDVRTDVYSFGCVMYETLSGHLAVDGDRSYEMMNKHINHAPVSLVEIRCAGATKAGARIDLESICKGS